LISSSPNSLIRRSTNNTPKSRVRIENLKIAFLLVLFKGRRRLEFEFRRIPEWQMDAALATRCGSGLSNASTRLSTDRRALLKPRGRQFKELYLRRILAFDQRKR
jgi:hypothetical protein